MTSTTTSPTRFTYPARDGLQIQAYRWEPAGPPRGIVQITHGVGEHLLRYQDVAVALAGAGFLVQGQDHRGHGATAGGTDQGQIGADGWAELVNDIDLLVNRGHDEFSGLPLVVVAHSLGSFAVQQYLLGNSDRVSAVALTGTSLLDVLEPAMDLEADMDLSPFNAPFAPARTDFDWLSRDDAQVDAYIADPACGFGLDADAMKAMFVAARPLADTDRLAAIRSDLPVYVAVGANDPVGGGGAALPGMLAERYRAAGLTDVTLQVYADARHEIFNETNRAEVVADLIAWLDRVVPAGA